MNLIISCRFNKELNLYNTTGDYNVTNNLLELTKINNNYKIIGEDIYIEKLAQSFQHLCDHVGGEINNIISIQSIHSVLIQKNLPTNINIYWYIIDLHGWSEVFNNTNLSSYKNLRFMSPYGYCYNIFNYKLKQPIYYLPHCVIHKIDFNNNPKNKILISGRGRKNVNRYPMRAKIYSYSLKDKRIEYFKPDHGYRINRIEELKNITCGQNYIKLLNSYRICFADDLIHYSPFIVCKFFEILSSGALLLASLNYTKTYFEKLGFIDGEDYISATSDNLLEKIEYVMDEKNNDLINKIRYNGYIKCNKYHTSKHRALQINEIIKNSDSVVKYTDGIKNTEYYLVNNDI